MHADQAVHGDCRSPERGGYATEMVPVHARGLDRFVTRSITQGPGRGHVAIAGAIVGQSC